jgi:hypothetical protein
MAKSLKNRKRTNSSEQQVSNPSASERPMLINNRPAFSGWPMIIGWAAMLIFTVHACTHMVAAGDTWVAMACGRHFVNHGVDTVEPFSANSHKPGPTEEEVKTWPRWAQWITDKVGLKTVKYWHPTGWINQNWLTHVLFYTLVPKSSYADGVSFTSNALVYWKFAIYIITVVCVFYTGRLLGVNPALMAVFACFALFTGRSFLDVRPAGFSNMLVAVFLLVLVLTVYRNKLFIWLIVPLTVFWSNVHGGYIYLFIMLVPFVIWHALMLLPKKWTLSGYSILAWIALYGLAFKFPHHENLTPIKPGSDFFLYLLLIFIAASIAITIRKQTTAGISNSYHIIASVVLFLCLITRFLPVIPRNITVQQQNELLKYISSSRLSFIAIFFFMMFLKLIIISFKDRIILNLDIKGIYHTIAAGFVAFVSMVLFNPFHLTNLTHTFVISLSKHAERWRDIREWHPAFDWSNPVGTGTPFLVMYILAWVVVIAWIAVLILTSGTVKQLSKRKTKDSGEYQWPKVDLSIVIIAAMTIYMAIRSRRFIPIAAIAACPIIAMFIEQMVRSVSAMINLRKHNILTVPRMSRGLQVYFILAGVAATSFFGTWWGLKFKRVYLDPWPRDPKFTSVFMRMTASDAKPFYALKFIKDNKLKGKMLNYWTEGGFIAWGQEPDPKTGRTPLQLFMDGRAQAAYDRKSFEEWTNIMFGGLPGSVGYDAMARAQMKASITRRSLGQILTADDYAKIGSSMSQELAKRGVWVVLMPASVYNDPDKGTSYYSMKAFDRDPNWRLVFFNNRQKLYVDIRTPEGRKLFEGIFNDSTIYPDDYHKNLIKAHSWLLYRPGIAEKKKGLDFAFNAFIEKPSQIAMLEIITYGQNFAELGPVVNKFCEDYFNKFKEHEAEWAKEDGHIRRVEAVRLACFNLRDSAKRQGDTKLADFYTLKVEEYLREIYGLSNSTSW